MEVGVFVGIVGVGLGVVVSVGLGKLVAVGTAVVGIMTFVGVGVLVNVSVRVGVGERTTGVQVGKLGTYNRCPIWIRVEVKQFTDCNWDMLTRNIRLSRYNVSPG